VKHNARPLVRVRMTNRWPDTPAQQVSGSFEYISRAMKKNSARQHELAILLRLLSSRFDPPSTAHQELRLASHTAQNKSTKLRNLVASLGWQANKRHRARPIFRLWFRLTESAPPRLMIPLLRFVTEKPIRGRSLDAYHFSKTEHGQKRGTRSQSTDSSTTPNLDAGS
jgi:hypothetical protein